MRNKIIFIVFLLVLVIIFCDNKVNASFWDNDSLIVTIKYMKKKIIGISLFLTILIVMS